MTFDRARAQSPATSLSMLDGMVVAEHDLIGENPIDLIACLPRSGRRSLLARTNVLHGSPSGELLER